MLGIFTPGFWAMLMEDTSTRMLIRRIDLVFIRYLLGLNK
jgi:hypothetical protein